ncbi:hypothetical protein Bca4012_037630 [Brassica carinata]
MFIGYSATQKGYKWYDPETRRVLVSREVKFVEERGYYEEQNQEDFKNLTSDRASTLKIILEGLGIKMNQEQQSVGSNPRSTPGSGGVQFPHIDHEGGNIQVEHLNKEREESSTSHDQSVESSLEHLLKPGNVLRLKKAIYGLKQSPRAWYRKLSTTLNGRGFRKSELDHTLFTLVTPLGIIVILVHVDDLIITGSDEAGVKATKEFLKSVFDFKDLGEMKYFLGTEICDLRRVCLCLKESILWIC